MSDKTGIEWTDATWNPIAAFDVETGKRGWFCTKISPGCAGCYAERLNLRLGNGHEYTQANQGQIRFELVNLDQPKVWKRPRKIFVGSMFDLFHDTIPTEFIDKIFGVMAECPQHTFQVLTKRPERMLRHLTNLGEFTDGPWPLPNVWLGITAEDETRLLDRWPYLMRTPAAIRFISYEPAVDSLKLWMVTRFGDVLPDWVICGGESGPNARPTNILWVYEALQASHGLGIPFFFKQWGEWLPVSHAHGLIAENTKFYAFGDGRRSARVGRKLASNRLDGNQYLEFPKGVTA